MCAIWRSYILLKKKIDDKKNKTKIITIGKKNYSLIVIPPKIYFSFKSRVAISLVANTINGVHNEKESIKVPII